MVRRIRLGRPALGALAAVLAVALVPAAALGSTAATTSSSPSTLTYTADPGEVNALTLTTDSTGSFVLTDPGAAITSIIPCVTDPGGFATCPGPGASVTNFLLSAGDGNDSVVVAPAASPYGTIDGGPGDDTLTGGTGPEKVDGSDGDDTLDGGTGPDDLSGGPDADTASYATRTASVSVSLDDLANDGSSGEGDNVHVDVENVTGGDGADTLAGDAGDNRLAGGAGADRVTGGLGHDRLDGGLGDDALFAADGVADVVACGSGNDTVAADALDTVSADCEHVTGNAAPPFVSILKTGLSALRSVRGVVRVALACRASAGARCRGTLTLRMTIHVRPTVRRSDHRAAAARHHRRRINLRLARHKFSLRAGFSGRVPLRLVRSAQARLVACRRLRVQVVATTRGAKGKPHTSTRAATLRTSVRRRVTHHYACS